jgi:hypothetical protein
MNRFDETETPARILARVVAKEMSPEEMERVAGGSSAITGTFSTPRTTEDFEAEN